MLTRYITRLRNSPKSVRDRHAFFIATGFTVVVSLLWLVTLPMTLKQSPVVDGEEVTASRPVASFFSRAREQTALLFATFTDITDTASTSEVSTVVLGGAGGREETIILTPEALAAARASSSIPYTPPATTTPRVVRIATTTTMVSTSTASTTPR